MDLINLHDYETAAQACIERTAWDYYQGGSDDEVTVRANRAAFERIRLRPRMLVDVSSIDLSTTVLGTAISMPVLAAPTAYHRLAHDEGECETARGVGAAATLMVLSTFSTRSLEDVAACASGPLWLQLYTYGSLQRAEVLIKRAEDAGYRAVAVTVDTPRLARREKDIRNQFRLPPGMHIAHLTAQEQNQHYIPEPLPLTWQDIDYLRSITSLPILLKGILTAEDALLAVERGIEGIIVSNHGGRQLDGALAGIEALPEVAGAVAGRCEVYMDGGIRRGTDILKALALGVRAVLVGRPILWGLAVNGAPGVHHVLEILRRELELAMALSGRPTLASIDRSLVQVM
jgi:4-hydroxymandelate oxidase